MAVYNKDSPIDAAIQKFQQFDKDRNGSIEQSELKAILKGCDDSWTESKIQALMESLDKNHDGSIQLEEFTSWVLRGFEEPDFRRQLGFAQPKVAWKKFDIHTTKDGVGHTIQGAHPSHKASVIFERIAVLYGLAPSEITLVDSSTYRHLSLASVSPEECLSDLGWVKYCAPGAEMCTLVVKTKDRLDDVIRQLHGNRDAGDEALEQMWFWPALSSAQRRATCLGDGENPVPGFECKITLIHKKMPPKNAWEKDDGPVDDQYPMVAFYVGDLENPKTLYGKQVFSLNGEFPGISQGLPMRWSNKAAFGGSLDTEEVKQALEEAREVAKEKADKMRMEAEEIGDTAKAEEAYRLRQSAFTGVRLTPLTKRGREMIHEIVGPFLFRIWEKMDQTKKTRDDGNYVSNLAQDGFEIGPPRELDIPDADGGVRTVNSILGVPVPQRLRLFKALQLLDIEAKD